MIQSMFFAFFLITMMLRNKMLIRFEEKLLFENASRSSKRIRRSSFSVLIFLSNHYVQNPFFASKCFDEKGKYYAMKFMEVQKKGIQLQFRGGYDQTFVEERVHRFISFN